MLLGLFDTAGALSSCQSLFVANKRECRLHVQDIGPRYSGVLLGLSNTAGVLAGVLGTAATGLILANGTWDEVWNVAVALYLVGTVVWNLFATGEQIFD